VTLQARHRLHDFTDELDFAARKVLEVAGPAFGPLWHDVDKGTGFVCIAGAVNGHKLLRFYKTVGQVSYTQIPVDDTNAIVNAVGRLSHWEGAGQVLLEDPKPNIDGKERDVAKAVAFLGELFPAWDVIWARVGTTWPVALIRMRRAGPTHWAFVQVATRYPDRQQALVELCLSTEAIEHAVPQGRRPQPPAFN